jgi:aminopeptidase YwaD
MISEIENQILRSISAADAYQHVENICKFGNRLAGSEADNKAAEYFAKTCSEYGLSTHFEEFEADCFEPITCELSLVEPESKTIESQPMIFSPSTPEEGITSDIIYVGTGQEKDYKGKEVKNKIVLFRRDANMPKDSFEPKDSFFAEVCTASKNGALGAIMANYQPWPYNGTLEGFYFDPQKRISPIEPNPIPAICISSTDGHYLQNLLEGKRVKIHLLVQANSKKCTTHNVRCLLPGTSLPQERLILCGHHDTQNTPGANDNTSGLGVLLELARVLSAYPCKRTIEFYSSGCEEGVSIGSLEYCKRHASTLQNIVAVFSIDMIGVGGDLYLITEGRWPDKTIITPEWLYSFVDKVARELNYKTKFGINEIGTSDEGRFLDAGVPALFFWKSEDEHYHSILDVPKYVDPNALKVVAEIAGLSAWRLANR